MGLLETAASALVAVERRTEIAARNIANAQTPGYKREIAYAEIVAATQSTSNAVATAAALPVTGSVVPAGPAGLSDTGHALDLAIAGEGFMLLRDGDRFYLSRGGQFRLDGEGRLEDTQGRKVQQVGGGDLLIDMTSPQILADGAVLSNGVPLGQVALVRSEGLTGTDLLRRPLTAEAALALPSVESPGLRQGMLEQSNVVLSDELVGLISNQRMAEAGAQMIRTYDGLLGQAVATFGRRG
jgi:flagellar basal-body rod protein FlgF